MRHCSQRQVLCPLFKGIVIDAKAVVTGQRHEIGILPRTTTLLHPMADGLSLLFQALRLQGSHPGMHHQARQFWNHLITRWVAVCLQQLVIVHSDGFRHVELHLTDKLAIGVHHLRIDDACYVKDYIVIITILVMTMEIPVRRLVVDLHVSHPQRGTNPDLRIEEVWPRISVMQTRVNHLDGLAVARLKFP